MSLTSYTTEQGSITPLVGRLQLNASNANVVSALFWITNSLGPTPSDFYLIVY
jgi:hypothetical protein